MDMLFPTRFCYCYRCYRKIRPNLLAYSCPGCESRFAEELINDTSSEDEFETSTSSSSWTSSCPSLWSSSSSSLSTSSSSSSSSFSSSSSDQYDLPFESFDQTLFIVSERFVFQTSMTLENDHDAERRHEQDMGSHHYHRTREPWGWHSPLRQGTWHERTNTLEEIFRQLVLTPTVQDMASGRWGMLYSNIMDSDWSSNGFEAVTDQFMNDFENMYTPTAGRARSANRNKIKNLQKVKITEEHVEAGSECTVCQEDYTVGENVRQLPCNHLFHYDCIRPWLEHRDICPVCRTTVSSHNTARNSPAYEE